MITVEEAANLYYASSIRDTERLKTCLRDIDSAIRASASGGHDHALGQVAQGQRMIVERYLKGRGYSVELKEVIHKVDQLGDHSIGILKIKWGHNEEEFCKVIDQVMSGGILNASAFYNK